MVDIDQDVIILPLKEKLMSEHKKQAAEEAKAKLEKYFEENKLHQVVSVELMQISAGMGDTENVPYSIYVLLSKMVDDDLKLPNTVDGMDVVYAVGKDLHKKA